MKRTGLNEDFFLSKKIKVERDDDEQHMETNRPDEGMVNAARPYLSGTENISRSEASKGSTTARCPECGGENPSKAVKHQGRLLRFCSDVCLINFKNKRARDGENEINYTLWQFHDRPSENKQVEKCGECNATIQADNAYYPTNGKIVPLCSHRCLTSYDRKHKIPLKCSQCENEIPYFDITFKWGMKEFCSTSCIEKYQTMWGCFCAFCLSAVESLSHGTYFIHCGIALKNFCSETCMASFKRNQKSCLNCKQEIAGIEKKGSFCSNHCMKRFNIASSKLKIKQKCSSCNKYDVCKIKVNHHDIHGFLCSDSCLSKFRYMKKIKKNLCMKCYKFFSTEKNALTNPCTKTKDFCSERCSISFTFSSPKLTLCDLCKIKKHDCDMIQVRDHNETRKIYCSYSCLYYGQKKCHFCKDVPAEFVVNENERVQYVCRGDMCLSTFADTLKCSLKLKTTLEAVKNLVKGEKKDNCANYKFVPIPVPVYIPVPIELFAMPIPSLAAFPVPVPFPIVDKVDSYSRSGKQMIRSLKQTKNSSLRTLLEESKSTSSAQGQSSQPKKITIVTLDHNTVKKTCQKKCPGKRCGQCNKLVKPNFGYYPTYGYIKSICSFRCLVLYNAKHMKSRCMECSREIDYLSINFIWGVKQFCSMHCLSSYQTTHGKFCASCGSLLTCALKDFLIFEGMLKSFCNAKCLKAFKQGTMSCPCCWQVFSGKEKRGRYCSAPCFNERDKMEMENPCSICHTLTAYLVQISYQGGQATLCSDKCLSEFRFRNDIRDNVCTRCRKFFDRKIILPITLDGDKKLFCSRKCRASFVSKRVSVRPTVPHCVWCSAMTAGFNMIFCQEPNQEPELFCSHTCLALVKGNCFSCGERVPAKFYITINGKSQKLCSAQCVVKCAAALTSSFTLTPVDVAKEALAIRQSQSQTKYVMVPVPMPIHVPLPLSLHPRLVPKPLPFPIPVPTRLMIPFTREPEDQKQEIGKMMLKQAQRKYKRKRRGKRK